nr:uncharacterized protein LOC109187345 [Ipomoea trifida]
MDRYSLGESTVFFSLSHHSSGLHLDAYLGNQFHHWMSALSPRVCGILSHYIVHSARWIGLANGGGTVVTASIEILDRERPLPTENNPRGLSVEEIKKLKEERFKNGSDELSVCPVCFEEFFPHRDASSSKPRGLSVEEIKKLKEERFKNGSDELSVCPVCFEEFLAGEKIAPLPCSHVFHHGCISSWLKKICKLPYL